MKRFSFALIALLLVAPAFAQEGPPPGVRAAHNHVIQFLELTEEQVLAWDELYRIHREDEQPLKEDIAAIQVQLDELFDAGNPDPGAVGELVIERRSLSEALIDVHVVYHEAFVALLDEEQVVRLSFIARADNVQRFIPAFKLFELIR